MVFPCSTVVAIVDMINKLLPSLFTVSVAVKNFLLHQFDIEGSLFVANFVLYEYISLEVA